MSENVSIKFVGSTGVGRLQSTHRPELPKLATPNDGLGIWIQENIALSQAPLNYHDVRYSWLLLNNTLFVTTWKPYR